MNVNAAAAGRFALTIPIPGGLKELESIMNSQRIGGIVFLVVGVVLLCVGMNASNSIADQTKHAFTGRFTDATAWYIFGGLAIALLGLFLSLFGPGSKSA
jgi:hypothetical protein